MIAIRKKEERINIYSKCENKRKGFDMNFMCLFDAKMVEQ